MSRTKLLLATAIVSAGLMAPLLARAETENVDTTPGTGKSVVSSWIKALDGKGDANAIGKYKSAKANKKYFHINGTVSAVSATSITVVNGNKTFTFDVDSSTRVIRKFKGSASISEVTVGDKTSIWATNKTDGIAKLIWDKSIWRVSLQGTVNGLDATAGTFNVVITKEEPHTGLMMTLTVPMRVSDDTDFFIGTTPAALTDLADGQTVTIRATWNIVGKYGMASKVVISQ